jgi:GNAT superfamily N-acetyltransferase
VSFPAVALEHKASADRIATAAAQGARAEWAQVDTDQIRPTWQARLPRVLALVVAAQRSAAGLSEPYLRQVLGLGSDATLNPDALAGVASDGRPLETLLEQPVVTVLSYLATGRAVGDAMAAGLAMLEIIVGTQVHDAARIADLIGITARRGVAYTRVVELPACDRCILLAGREYSYSEGFERHPNCDCAVLPIRTDEPAHWSTPRELFDAMSPAEQARRFGQAAAAAIAAGADIGQVVNARRGMTVAGGRLVTTEGTTRRGYAGARMAAAAGTARTAGDRYARAAVARPMPEQILAEAPTREAAIADLRRYGYLT